MNNSEFLAVLKESFLTYLRTGASSNEKLKILHGAVSKDIYQRLGEAKYRVASLGWGNGTEAIMRGRYAEKAVDITVFENGVPIAGIAVKYVMSNYSQNSNNYFENMLGETANIRSANHPYFQIFIIPDRIPYFNQKREIKKWENITPHHLQKYIKLSNDDINMYFHTPNKMLVFAVHMQGENECAARSLSEYREFYLNHPFDFRLSGLSFDFGNTIIYNDYDKFLQEVVYAIKNI